MTKNWFKNSGFGMALVACSFMAMTTGCASGGFKLTRQYAGWVNSQNVILRVILYILTGIVFFVTILVDVVVNNTIDFWDGKVSAGTYEFKDGEKLYQAKHEYLPGSHLRRSTIQVTDVHGNHLQEVVLNETPYGEIEMYVDKKLRTKVNHISEMPVAAIYDKNGKLVQEEVLLLTPEASQVASAK